MILQQMLLNCKNYIIAFVDKQFAKFDWILLWFSYEPFEKDKTYRCNKSFK